MKKKLLLTLLLWGTSAFDSKTTLDLLHHGGVEYNPLFGRRPSDTKVIGLGAVVISGETFLLWKTKGKFGAVVKAIVIGQSAAHIGLGIHNQEWVSKVK
jgi:hypothetical protein